MRPFGWYLLWQAPGWLVVTLVVIWLVRRVGLPVWVAVTVIALMVARDLAVYPALRSALARSPYLPAPIGATGETVEPLAPTGYVRVNGELWRARALRPEDHVPSGARVLVRDARGLTLLVEPSAGPRR